MKAVVFLCALLCTAHAYSVNRCVVGGKVTYQDAPCPGDLGTTGEAAKTSQEEREIYERDANLYGRPGQDVPDSLCAKRITSHVIFKDPYSVRVDSVTRMKPEIRYASGEKVVTKVHYLMVNAKNSYGGYVGSKLYICRLSEDEKTVKSIGLP